MEMRTEGGRRAGICRRGLPLLMAAVMILTMGFLPTGQAAASGPAYKAATKPATYKKGDYKIFNCIDISAWQGTRTVDQFKKMKKDGVTHVILRSSFTYMNKNPISMELDKVFRNNINNAASAGLKIGIYHYSQAKSTKEAKKEANFTLKQINTYKSKITLPVVFDWEFGGRLNSSYAKSKGKAYCTSICNAFCNVIKDAGYEPMVYANLSTMNGYLNENIYKKWKIWLAQYNKTCGYNHDMYMWQYSSSGRIDGLSGNIDVNYLFAPIVRVKQDGGKAPDRFKCKDVAKGRYLKSQWLTLQGTSYRLDSSGYCLTGYQKVGNYYYGFDSTSGAAYKNRTTKIGSKTYMFDKKGRSVLYSAKTTAKLAYREGPSILKKKMGTFSKGKTVYIIRESGDWVQASNGYWCKKEMTVLTNYPL